MNHKQEIENAVKQFRKQVDKIQTSDHPQYKDPEIKDYEIKALRAELDAKVAEINNDFHATLKREIEKATPLATSSRIFITESDKRNAQYVLDEYVADIALAYDDVAKHAANEKLEARLDAMTTHGELAHVRQKLPEVLGRINGDPIATRKLKSTNEKLAALKTPEQERLDDLKAEKVSGADSTYRRLKMTHPAYSHLRDNQSNGGFMEGR